MGDIKLYNKYIRDLANTLEKCVLDNDRDIIIALSRKGPRMLSYFENKDFISSKKVVTELSLPYLFKHIEQDKGGKYRLFIVDDAIYYGSTIKSVYELVCSYIDIFDLSSRVDVMGIFTAIKDKDSIDFGSVKIMSNTGVRSGFGHVFVKQLMKDLRKLNCSLEVEFPVVVYPIEGKPSIKDIYKRLSEYYGENRVYLVDGPESINSITILLSDINEATFRKLRIFVDDNELKIVVIAPELISDGISKLRYVRFGENESVNNIWSDIFESLSSVYSKCGNDFSLNRNVTHAGIVLLNFFSSLDTFCYEKKEIEDSLSLWIDSTRKASVDAQNIEYLVGDIRLVKEIKSSWDIALSQEDYWTKPIITEKSKSDEIVTESTEWLDVDLKPLQETNIQTLSKCKTMEEALSSMMFNQTMMIDRWSRGLGDRKQGRLRFGYSFNSIWNFLWKYATKDFAYDMSALKMHRWIDIQIDNGSLVPQYIINHRNGLWTRVFRPGENEDVSTSHIGRFVAHVINLLKDKKGKNFPITISLLDGLLKYVYLTHKVQIMSEEPSLNLVVSTSPRLLWQDTNESLVNYLIRMSILSDSAITGITLNPRITDSEFCCNTTLSLELINSIDLCVSTVMERFTKNDSPVYSANEIVLNSFLAPYFDVNDIKEKLTSTAGEFCELITDLQAGYSKITDKAILNDVATIGLIYIKTIRNFEVNMTDLLSSELQPRLLEVLWKVRQMIFIMNIAVSVYIRKIDVLTNYRASLTKDIMSHLHSEEIFSYIDDISTHKELLYKDRIFLLKMKGYVNNIILDFSK